MAAPSSKATICNLALDYLVQTNDEVVTNIDTPRTQTEVVCNRWYDMIRRSVLRGHPWSFASRRTILTASSIAPLFGYTLAYNLPNDFLRLNTLQDTSSFDPYPHSSMAYQVENGQILTNGASGSSLNVRYVYDFTNVALMDALFVDLFAIELALAMSFKFTSSNTDIQRLKSLRDDKRAQAKAINGQERPPTRIERSNAASKRRLSGSNQVSSLRYE